MLNLKNLPKKSSSTTVSFSIEIFLEYIEQVVKEEHKFNLRDESTIAFFGNLGLLRFGCKTQSNLFNRCFL